ncbi:DMT family transporter, partial [Escherichia coli]|nr:DMT family transporter [Escherichia coli]
LRIAARTEGRERWLWRICGWLFVFQVANTHLDMHALVVSYGRCLARAQGWYQGRHDIQLVVLIGALALAVATLTVRSASSGGNLIMIVGLQMRVGSAVLGEIGAATETWAVTISPLWLAAFAYTTLVPGLLATITWFVLVGRIGAVRAATFHFLNPFFGVAIAAVLLNEKLGVMDVVGVAVIAAGILAVQLSRQER